MVVIFAAAVLAPLAGGLVFGPRVPPVVLEILIGILIGPKVLDLAEETTVVAFFSTLGLSFLFFMAGMEIDFQRIEGSPLTLALVTWFMSIAIGLSLGAVLQGTGVVLSSLLVGVALTTTALGTLMPILRDNDELTTPFGTLVMGAGAVGEFGPIVLVSTLLSSGSVASSLGAILTFAALALAIAVTALKLHPPNVMRVVTRSMHTSAQLPVRMTIALVGALVLLTAHVGLDAVLGAFAAGVIVSLVAGRDREELDEKLDAIAFGVFIPVFFVVTGVTFDLAALGTEPALWRLPVFLAMFWVARGLPALFIYRRGASKPLRPHRLLTADVDPAADRGRDRRYRRRERQDAALHGLGPGGRGHDQRVALPDDRRDPARATARSRADSVPPAAAAAAGADPPASTA